VFSGKEGGNQIVLFGLLHFHPFLKKHVEKPESTDLGISSVTCAERSRSIGRLY